MKLFEQQIREHAYFIWENEGRVFGRAEEHWLRAEHEVHAAAAQMPLQSVAPALTLAASPAETLDRTLKARSTRSRSAAAKVAAAPAGKAATKAPAKPATKAATAKAAAPKPAATKSATAKAAAKAPAQAIARTKAPRATIEAGASIH